MYMHVFVHIIVRIFTPDLSDLGGQQVHGPHARERGHLALQQVRREGPLPSYGGCSLCQYLSLGPTHRRADRAARSGLPPALRHEDRDRTSYW
jgi:hypothetical protein